MITFVITNRNRNLDIVKKCLESLLNQTNKEFSIYLVDYGSESIYLNKLKELTNKYLFVTVLEYPVSGQLWNKSRAINTVLKECKTPFFFVGDIDMIYSPFFVELLCQKANDNEVTYFQVGFLNQSESKNNKEFNDYKISFTSNHEATGMTLFPTKLLKEVNGYDEFYHGWGAEDTDVHIRLKNKGAKVNYYNDKILMLHQYHPKQYRSKNSKEPFHSKLELINHQYIKQVQKHNIIYANRKLDYGNIPNSESYTQLKNPHQIIEINNEKNTLDAFIYGEIFQLPRGIYEIRIFAHPKQFEIKNKLKLAIKKKGLQFHNMNVVNNLVLLQIVSCFRNHPYYYEFDKKLNQIVLKIYL